MSYLLISLYGLGKYIFSCHVRSTSTCTIDGLSSASVSPHSSIVVNFSVFLVILQCLFIGIYVAKF